MPAYNDDGTHRNPPASEMLMEPEQVEKLEAEVGKAIALVVRRRAKGRAIPKPKGDRIHHLMAKAAVAVFEAMDEERGQRR